MCMILFLTYRAAEHDKLRDYTEKLRAALEEAQNIGELEESPSVQEVCPETLSTWSSCDVKRDQHFVCCFSMGSLHVMQGESKYGECTEFLEKLEKDMEEFEVRSI